MKNKTVKSKKMPAKAAKKTTPKTVKTTVKAAPKRSKVAELTEQELKTIKLICQEFNSNEIADKFGVSVKTVEKIRTGLFQKTNSKNMVGLVKYAIKHQIYVIK